MMYSRPSLTLTTSNSDPTRLLAFWPPSCRVMRPKPSCPVSVGRATTSVYEMPSFEYAASLNPAAFSCWNVRSKSWIPWLSISGELLLPHSRSPQPGAATWMAIPSPEWLVGAGRSRQPIEQQVNASHVNLGSDMNAPFPPTSPGADG